MSIQFYIMHNIKLNEYEYVKITMKTPKIWPIINANINIKGIIQRYNDSGYISTAISFPPGRLRRSKHSADETNLPTL